MGMGRRFRDLTVGEMCTVVYGWAVANMDQEHRTEFDDALSPDELVAIGTDDESFPEELRGERPPIWWKG